MSHWTERTEWTLDELRQAVAADTINPDNIHRVHGEIELDDRLIIRLTLDWNERLNRWTLADLDCDDLDASVRFVKDGDRDLIQVATDYGERWARWDCVEFRKVLDGADLPEPLATKGANVATMMEGPNALYFRANPEDGYVGDDGEWITGEFDPGYEEAEQDDDAFYVIINLGIFRALFLLRDTYGAP